MDSEDKDISGAYLELLRLGVPDALISLPITGAMYMEKGGGPALESYWTDQPEGLLTRQRNEFFLAGTSAIACSAHLNMASERHEWGLAFAVAYLFQTKSLVQSINSVDLLCRAHCYADAFSVIRTLHSRVNFLLLCSLGPHLFDEWLKHPKHEKFLDGHIREELRNHKIGTFTHLYELFSEIVHGQYQGLADIGYLEQGLFPEIKPIANMVYVAGKFLLGLAGYIGTSVLALDQRQPHDGKLPEGVSEVFELFEWLRREMLVPNRFDHLWTMTGEERHWTKIKKDEYLMADWFDFSHYRAQLALFHRERQPKELGKKYRLGSKQPT